METTGGRTGLRVAADFSHYLHQIGNPHFPQWPAIAAGQLNLDPLDPDNLLSRRIVEAGLVGKGHLRAAVPNDLPRDRGSIQYPIVDPRGDAATAALPNGGMHRPWDLHGCGPGESSIGRSSRISSHIPNAPRPGSRQSTWATERRATSAWRRTATSTRIWLPSPSPMP